MAETIVDIHISARSAGIPDRLYIDEGLAKWGRPELAMALVDRGVRPVFSRGPAAYNFASGNVDVLRPLIGRTHEGNIVVAAPSSIAVTDIDAIRNITGALGHNVPELNHPVVRETAKDKVATNTILARLGLSKAFAPWAKGGDIDEALDAIPSDRVVLKPRKGMRSENIQIGTKAGIAELAQTGGLGDVTEWILEEEVGFRAALALRGLDAEQQTKIDTVNARELPKELRAYSFGRDEDGRAILMYVLRAAQLVETHLSDDKWVFLEQESVPVEISAQTNKVLNAFEEATGVREMHIAVDWGLVTKAGESEPIWLPTEVNGTEPQLIYRHNHPDVADQQAGLLADQLYRIAQKRSTR